MNLPRKIKINSIHPVSFTEKETEIIEFIKSKISDLEEYTSDEYPLSTFFKNSKGEVIMEQDDKNDRLWVKYKDFWSVLEMKHSLEYTDTQKIIHFMVEMTLKSKVSTPLNDGLSNLMWVEMTLKRKVSTPILGRNGTNYSVEMTFKRKVSTPSWGGMLNGLLSGNDPQT